jgi:hypothetical protein
MTVTNFSELELDERLIEALSDKGYSRPTAIQAEAIPPAMDGRDVLGSAPTQHSCCLLCNTCWTFRVKSLVHHVFLS